MHILIIEDDQELCDALQLQLLARNHTTDCCHTGSDALYFALNGAYDLILLDRMLPEIDGMTVLRSLRQNHIGTPVILTTALGALNDRIDGLDCGADDYLVKPYDIGELLARIRALCRRPGTLEISDMLSFEDLEFSPSSLNLCLKGKSASPDAGIHLSRREAVLMEYFLQRPNQTLPRQLIYTRVWGPDAEVEDGNLDTYIYYLRKHLRTLKSRVHILTVHGIGYKMEAEA